MEMTDNQLKAMQLRNYQAMPLGAKIRRSEELIRQALEHYNDMMYIALSGGKDSCVTADIVWSIDPAIPAVFCDTGNELQSVLDHVRSMIEAGKPIIVIKPAKSFWEIVEEEGWPILSKNICMGISRFVRTKSMLQKKLRAFGGINPTSGKKQQATIPKKFHYVLRAVLAGKLKTTNKCCGYLKIHPTKPYEKETGRKPFVGTMAAESKNRFESYLKNGCNAFDSGASRPIMFWTEQDILQYHLDKNLPLASAYGEIKERNGELYCTDCQRTGCKFCMFGVHLEKGENRIQYLARAEPESHADFIAHGGDKVMDYIGVDWRPFKEPDVQTDMFDARYEIDVKELHGE